jgi:ATP-binding cassette subfamily B protein
VRVGRRVAAAPVPTVTTHAASPAPAAVPLRTWPHLRKLFARFRPVAAGAAGALALVLLRTGLELLAPFFVQRAVDTLSAAPAGALPDGYTTMLALLGAVLLVRVAVTYASAVASAAVAQSIENRFRADLFRRVTLLRFRWHDRNRSGKTIARSLRDMERARLFFREVAFGYAELVVLLALGLVACATVHWAFGLAIAVTSTTAFLLTLRVGGRIARMDLASDEEYDHVSTVLQENVAGARVIRAFGREHEESQKFGGRLGAFTSAWQGLARFWTGTMTWVGSIHNCGLVATLVVGTALVGAGETTAGGVAAVFLIVRAMSQRLRNMSRLVVLGQQSVASAARVFEVLENDDVIAPPARPVRLPAPAPGTRGGALRIENVSFAYNAGTPVLRDVTLDVPAGGSLGILGPTGAGKTTLVQLLPRFYDPDAGRITLDGADLRDLDPDELTAAVGIVFQEPFLFSATVAANIAYGNPGVPRERVEECARLAAAHDFVAKLPQGYDTIVGERGVSLSGGQRQRLTIARALATDPRVLVFDDATASVDAVTERELFEGIRSAAQGRTTLVISQRITSLRWCDRIAVLDRGRVVDAGTHEELLVRCDLYREVFEHQRIQGTVR